ncbi:MAG: hypothetical protein ACE3L7_14625 [Candidatus Pristimantibacillus sp.]
MGTITRSGPGFGMNEYEARIYFGNLLTKPYGERGGGEDIIEWLSSKCIQKPIPAVAARKTTTVKASAKGSGKLVNGFRISNETSEFIRLQISAHYFDRTAPVLEEEFTLTSREAKKKANDMALRLNVKVQVEPCRLWQDEATKRLSLPSHSIEVSPVGGRDQKNGKWEFEVDVRD